MFATYMVMEPTMLAEPFQVSLHVWDIIKDVKTDVTIYDLERLIYDKLYEDGYRDAAIKYIEYKQNVILHVANINYQKNFYLRILIIQIVWMS